MSSEATVDRYRALLDAARYFGRAMDLRALIDEILRRAEEVMQAEACSLLLPDPKTGELILHSTDPSIASRLEPVRVPPGAGIAGAVFQSKQSINLKDARNDPRHYSGVGQQLGKVTRAMVTIPLLDGASCLGVMQALNPLKREWFDTEDEEIFEGFGGLIVNALVRLEAQKREVERAGARQQLFLAKEIQDSFSPPTLSEFPFCQVYHSHLAAQMVSGDFGFVHPVGANRLLLGLGDVCGKGIPAALTMARTTAIIATMTQQIGEDLGAWVTKLNPILSRELKAGRFIGLALLLADAESRTLQVCTAGQFAPFQFDGRQWSAFPAANHLPLGILPTTGYTSQRASLRPGESWLLFTDGFPEARNRRGEDYTVESFRASLPLGETAPETLISAYQAWDNFRDPFAQHDDASLLLLNWRGNAPPPELRLSCCPENLTAIRDFIEQWAQFAGYSDIIVGQIIMACDEASSNVFRHGYSEKPGPIHVRAEITEDSLVIQIADDSPPVEPKAIRGRELSDLRPGGLGTVVISQVFDEVTYTPTGNGNCLTLRKALP